MCFFPRAFFQASQVKRRLEQTSTRAECEASSSAAQGQAARARILGEPEHVLQRRLGQAGALRRCRPCAAQGRGPNGLLHRNGKLRPQFHVSGPGLRVLPAGDGVAAALPAGNSCFWPAGRGLRAVACGSTLRACEQILADLLCGAALRSLRAILLSHACFKTAIRSAARPQLLSQMPAARLLLGLLQPF